MKLAFCFQKRKVIAFLVVFIFVIGGGLVIAQTVSHPWSQITDLPPALENPLDICTAPGGLCAGGDVQCEQIVDCTTNEIDPQVGTVTSNKWCRGTGSQVNCDQNAPSGGGVTLVSEDSGITLSPNPITATGSVAVKYRVYNCPSGQAIQSFDIGLGDSVTGCVSVAGGNSGWIHAGNVVSLENTNNIVEIGFSPPGSSLSKLRVTGGITATNRIYASSGDSPSPPSCDGNGDVCSYDDLVAGGTLIVHNLATGATGYPVEYSTTLDQFIYELSSARYKDNIQPLRSDFYQVLQVAPKSFTTKKTGARDIGYLAEEFDELGLHDLVIYNEQGLPESIQYDKISLYIVEVVKDQQEIIKYQQKQIDALTSVICKWAPWEEVCNTER